MFHKKALESFDRNLRDLKGNSLIFLLYCLVVLDKLCRLYHVQHPVMNLMHALNLQFYGVIYKN